MAIRRYDPFREMTTLQDEMERMFRNTLGTRDYDAATSAGAWAPALDVEEDEDKFTIHVELPGVSPEDVELTLEDDVLTISGERSFYDERDAEGFKRIERRFGRFHRAVRLPDRVDADKVEASAREGLLTITVPKAEEAKPRRIEISSG